MELIYAALLLHSAGKDVNEDNVEDVLSGAGIDADSAQVKALIAALEDVDIEDAMEQAVATGAAPAAPAEGGASEADEEAADEAPDDEDEAEAPDEEGASEEEAAEGLGSLF